MPRPLRALDPVPAADDCCAQLGDGPLDAAEADALADRLKALADPARLRLLSLILATPTGEACTCDLLAPMGLSQPTVTHHLRRLEKAGLVSAHRRGRLTYYRTEPRALSGLTRVLACG